MSKRESVIEGAPGHGCGHNTMGTAAVAAAIATKRAMETKGIEGTIKVFGCGGKPIRQDIQRDGLFDGVDVVIIVRAIL